MFFRNVFGVDVPSNNMPQFDKVFGLNKAQAYTEELLDDNRRTNCFGLVIVGFEERSKWTPGMK